jgi:hypothetical protein
MMDSGGDGDCDDTRSFVFYSGLTTTELLGAVEKHPELDHQKLSRYIFKPPDHCQKKIVTTLSSQQHRCDNTGTNIPLQKAASLACAGHYQPL